MEGKEAIIVFMETEAKRKFQAECKKQDRTMGSKIRELIKKWMAR